MALNAREAKSNGKKIEPVEPGSYPARLVQVIDLGLQPQSYNGEVKSPQQEISVTYELLDEFLKDDDGNDIPDKPRWFSETFALHNLAADRAKSTARYYALDPKEQYEGDWSKLLGTPCIVTIVNKAGTGKNKGKIFNNIASISAMRPREADKAPDLINKPVFLDLTDPSEASLEVFSGLPDWLKKKIRDGLEFHGSEFHEALENYTPKKNNSKSKTREAEPSDEDSEDEGENW